MIKNRITAWKLPGVEISLPEKAIVTFFFDGAPIEGRDGEPVAMSLWAQGQRVLGYNEESGNPRGVFCNIGQCFECRVTVDGRRDQRSCLTFVKEGMQVRRQLQPDSLTVVDGMERP